MRQLALLILLGLPIIALATGEAPETTIGFCVPIEFILFAVTLLGLLLGSVITKVIHLVDIPVTVAK